MTAWNNFNEIKTSINLCWVLCNISKFATVVEGYLKAPFSIATTPRCKTLKMVFDTSLLNTQQYKVGIKGKVEQSRKRNSTLLYTSV